VGTGKAKLTVQGSPLAKKLVKDLLRIAQGGGAPRLHSGEIRGSWKPNSIWMAERFAMVIERMTDSASVSPAMSRFAI